MKAISCLILTLLGTLSLGFQTTRSNYVTKIERPTLSRFVSSVSNLETTAKGDEVKKSVGLGAWIPIGSASAISGLTPLKIEIFGDDYVVWEPTDGKSTNRWAVMKDLCPHRLVKLSQGRVDPVSGCIECPYHGWQFDTDGCLTSLPQLENSARLPNLTEKGSAESYPVHLTGDLIWAFLPSDVHGESFPIDLLPEQYYLGLENEMKSNAVYTTVELSSSADLLIENSLDPSHIAFAHHGILGSREDASPLPMKVVTSNFTQLDISCQYTRNGQLRDRIYSYQRPCLVCTKEKAPNGDLLPGVMFFYVPVREGRTRSIVSLNKKVAKTWLPQWIRDVAVIRLTNGDQILHDGERERSNGKKYFNPTSADLGVNAFSVWRSKYGMKNGPPHAFGQASRENLVKLSKAEQNNPWVTHTSSCSRCQKALRLSKRAKVASAVLGFLGWSIFQQRKQVPLAFTCAALGALGNYISRRVIITLEGSPNPGNIPSRGFSMDL